MNTRFERTGPLAELTSYPQWAQDMVAECESTRQVLANHEFREMMTDGSLTEAGTATFMKGIWPVIERFPGYMALSLLKTRYGRSAGDDLARRWLVRNIRVEQNHAEYWLDWAEGAGVPRDELLRGVPVGGTEALANWCEDVCTNGTLAAGIAASNYAVEGATGECAQFIYSSKQYTESFPAKSRVHTLRWLQVHAEYDDIHPWEALEIVCTLMGTAPAADEVKHVAGCIKRSYTSMRLLLDRCVQPDRSWEPVREAVA